VNLNPYQNNGIIGDGGRKTFNFKLEDGEFSEPTEQAEFHPIGPEDGEAMEMMKDLIRVILIEDFGIKPGAPCRVTCSGCAAFENQTCILKAFPQPDKLPMNGCFEGIPKDED